MTTGTELSPSTETSERARQWASTMAGHDLGGLGAAHAEPVGVGSVSLLDRVAREEAEDATLAERATRSRGAGRRAVEEEPDPWRTCFERDRDRILHSAAFRRLAGKTQVFIFPADHQRTRLTHALEVAQVATAVARACRLNVALAEAIALGHDCGHGPGGHASEDALSPFLAGGFDHAEWGAEVTAAPLNLCAETLDGIRHHSWSSSAPSTPEGEVVALADRIAYTAHDLEDAVHAGIVAPEDLPGTVVERCGARRGRQLQAFVTDVASTTIGAGIVALSAPMAEALADLRRFDYERIYLRPASLEQSRRVIDMLQALVEYFAARPSEMPAGYGLGGEYAARRGDPADRPDVVRAVGYVAGMTDRFACVQASARLSWPSDRMPRGFDAA